MGCCWSLALRNEMGDEDEEEEEKEEKEEKVDSCGEQTGVHQNNHTFYRQFDTDADTDADADADADIDKDSKTFFTQLNQKLSKQIQSIDEILQCMEADRIDFHSYMENTKNTLFTTCVTSS